MIETWTKILGILISQSTTDFAQVLVKLGAEPDFNAFYTIVHKRAKLAVELIEGRYILEEVPGIKSSPLRGGFSARSSRYGYQYALRR